MKELSEDEITDIVRQVYAGNPPHMGEASRFIDSDSLIDRFVAQGYIDDARVLDIYETPPLQLEWDVDQLDYLVETIPDERMEELWSGATPTDEELLIYRKTMLDHRENSDSFGLTTIYRFTGRLETGEIKPIFFGWRGHISGYERTTWDAGGPFMDAEVASDIKAFVDFSTSSDFEFILSEANFFPEQADLKQWLEVRHQDASKKTAETLRALGLVDP